MARDADPPDVDFVLGADDPDRELQPPRARRRGRASNPRWRLRLGVGIALLIVSVAAVRTITGEHGSPGAAADPTATQVLGNSATPRPGSAGHLLLDPSTGSGSSAHGRPAGPDSAGFCPEAGDGQSACATSHTVPAAVLTAIRTAFPGARAQMVTNDVLRDVGLGEHGLWYRLVFARAGHLLIAVQVTQRHPGDLFTSGSTDVGPTRIRFSTRVATGFLVQVQVNAPRPEAPGLTAVRRLAFDSRLFATD